MLIDFETSDQHKHRLTTKPPKSIKHKQKIQPLDH